MVRGSRGSSNSFGTFLQTTQRGKRSDEPGQRVLRVLNDGKPVEFTDIVKRTKLSPSIVIDILQGADFAGLIIMETGQGGARRAKLTSSGKKLLTE